MGRFYSPFAPGIDIHITSESVFTSPRNDYSHAPESAIRWEVEEIERFPTAKHFASYTGLVPSTYASSTRMVHGRLTKQGNKWLRWAFIEAITPAIRNSPSLACFYQKIKVRRGAKDARAATARKLAALTWTVWHEQRCYQER